MRNLLNLKETINVIKVHLAHQNANKRSIYNSEAEDEEIPEFTEFNTQMRNHLIKNLKNLAFKYKIDFDDFLK